MKDSASVRVWGFILFVALLVTIPVVYGLVLGILKVMALFKYVTG